MALTRFPILLATVYAIITFTCFGFAEAAPVNLSSAERRRLEKQRVKEEHKSLARQGAAAAQQAI